MTEEEQIVGYSEQLEDFVSKQVYQKEGIVGIDRRYR
jgi:hypothetical protein